MRVVKGSGGFIKKLKEMDTDNSGDEGWGWMQGESIGEINGDGKEMEKDLAYTRTLCDRGHIV